MAVYTSRLRAITTTGDGAAIGDGTTDDTAALQAVLTAGNRIELNPRKTYLITSRLNITADGTGIEGNGATIIMSTGAGHFDNATYSGRLGASAVGIYAANVDGVYVRNVKIETSAWTDNRYLKAAYFNNCDSILFENVEVTGFSKGGGLIEIDDCDDATFDGVHVHHCYSNATLNADGSSVSAVEAQISGIVADANAASGSARGKVINSKFRYLTLGNSLRAAAGYQSDGVSLLGRFASKPNALGWIIMGNTFEQVGEGVDDYCNDTIIVGNQFKRCFGGGAVLKNGASGVQVVGNKFRDCGLTAIYVASSSLAGDLDRNLLAANDIDTSGITTGWETADGGAFGSVSFVNPSLIRIDADNSDVGIVKNTMIRDNIMEGGGTAEFGLYMGSGSTASPTHTAQGNIISGTTGKGYKDENANIRVLDNEISTLRQLSAHTLENQTASQPAFNNPSDAGAFNAETGIYEAEGYISVTGLSSTSGTISFGFGGTAAYGRASGLIEARKASSGALEVTTLFTTTPTPVVCVTASVNTVAQIKFKIRLRVTTAGTIVPAIAMSVAAAASVAQESWCTFTRINARTSSGDFA